jgi:uncharacterized protein (TIGR02996 family)
MPTLLSHCPYNPTSEDQAFMRAIIASPEDDAPRLVYADWLDDHREEDKATWIQGSIESKRTGALCTASYLDYKRNLKQSLGVLGVSTIGGWTPHIFYTDIDNIEPLLNLGDPSIICFERGFVNRVICTFDEWIYYLGTKICNNPITSITIKGKIPFRAVDTTTELNRWVFWRNGPGSVGSEVPDEIFNHVYPYSETSEVQHGPLSIALCCGFRTVAAAYKALTQGCLDWARSEAEKTWNFRKGRWLDDATSLPEECIPYNDPKYWARMPSPLTSPRSPDLD